MTLLLFRDDAYLTETSATVTGITDRGGVVLDTSLFYPTGGGQPGDGGRLAWGGTSMQVVTTVKADGDDIALIPPEGAELPRIGTQVTQHIDWDRRYAHMRVHTALHLLSVVVPLPVTGGAISEGQGRLDFAMPEPPADPKAIEDQLNALIARDLEVSESWITDAELAANPDLVKTMSVQPPSGAGHVRLVRIGQGDDQVDLQPCGGTHVAKTAEIGHVTLTKIENKGKQNRRVKIRLD